MPASPLRKNGRTNNWRCRGLAIPRFPSRIGKSMNLIQTGADMALGPVPSPNNLALTLDA
jgi:hypothetical protein